MIVQIHRYTCVNNIPFSSYFLVRHVAITLDCRRVKAETTAVMGIVVGTGTCQGSGWQRSALPGAGQTQVVSVCR